MKMMPSQASTVALDTVKRVWLLGGFRVSVGSRTIGEDRWRLRKAAGLQSCSPSLLVTAFTGSGWWISCGRSFP